MRTSIVTRTVPYLVFAAPSLVFGASPAAQKLQGILCTVADWVYTFAMVAGIIFVVIAAFKYMSSGGDSGKVGEAHRSLLYGALGIAVAIVSWSAPRIVGELLQTGGVTPCPS